MLTCILHYDGAGVCVLYCRCWLCQVIYICIGSVCLVYGCVYHMVMVCVVCIGVVVHGYVLQIVVLYCTAWDGIMGIVVNCDVHMCIYYIVLYCVA